MADRKNLDTLKHILTVVQAAERVAYATWVAAPGYANNAKATWEAARDAKNVAHDAHSAEFVRVSIEENIAKVFADCREVPELTGDCRG